MHSGMYGSPKQLRLSRLWNAGNVSSKPGDLAANARVSSTQMDQTQRNYTVRIDCAPDNSTRHRLLLQRASVDTVKLTDVV